MIGKWLKFQVKLLINQSVSLAVCLCGLFNLNKLVSF